MVFAMNQNKLPTSRKKLRGNWRPGAIMTASFGCGIREIASLRGAEKDKIPVVGSLGMTAAPGGF
jgi:hypothetical protein